MKLRILQPDEFPGPEVAFTMKFTAADHSISRTAEIVIEWTGTNDIFTIADLNEVADEMMEHLAKLIKRVGQ